MNINAPISKLDDNINKLKMLLAESQNKPYVIKHHRKSKSTTDNLEIINNIYNKQNQRMSITTYIKENDK